MHPSILYHITISLSPRGGFKVWERGCTNPRWRLFSSTASADARGRSRPRVAPGVVSQLIGPVRRSESRVVSDGRGCGTPRWTWRSTRTTAALDGHELLARASSRQQNSKTLRRILFVKRKRSNATSRRSTSQKARRNLCMDRRQSEARICSARGMQLLTAAMFEARLRSREASPEVGRKKTRALLPSDYSGFLSTNLRRCFPAA